MQPPYDARGWMVGLSVGWLVGWSVSHNLPEGREVALQCSYRSTCLSRNQLSNLVGYALLNVVLVEWPAATAVVRWETANAAKLSAVIDGLRVCAALLRRPLIHYIHTPRDTNKRSQKIENRMQNFFMALVHCLEIYVKGRGRGYEPSSPSPYGMSSDHFRAKIRAGDGKQIVLGKGENGSPLPPPSLNLVE